MPDSLISSYHPRAGFFDEAVDGGGRPHPYAQALVDSLERLGPDGLAAAADRRDAIFVQQGITFEASGEDGPVKDRPFPLDLIPRIMPAAEWRTIKRGVAQRVRALNRFVEDVYHERGIVNEGIVPWELVVTRPNFARAAHRIRPPGGVWCHVSGCDLVRDTDGSWKVLEDNVRTPSGISYVLENRIAMSRLVPDLFDRYSVRPVNDYPSLLLDALRAVAPGGGEQPTVVVWTPGSANSAYFEHAFLARQMGVELVEASDLVVRDTTVFMRTTRGLSRVDAIYRRIDDDFIDPLEFRPDSLLGVPGLMRAYRAGNVAIANALGTGVADDKAVYHYVPEMIRFYLGEEPILDNVRTYLLGDREQREHALSRLDELVVKPTGESGGKGVFIGPHATAGADRGAAPAAVRVARALDRPGDREPVHRAHRAPRRLAGALPRGPAAVRRVRRRDLDRARRAHAGGAARGLDDREQLPGRRLEGHLGAGRRAGRAGAGRDRSTRSTRPPCRDCARPAGTSRSASSSRRASGLPGQRPVCALPGGACWPATPMTCTGWAATWCAPSTPRACSTACSTPTCRDGPTTPPRSR